MVTGGRLLSFTLKKAVYVSNEMLSGIRRLRFVTQTVVIFSSLVFALWALFDPSAVL